MQARYISALTATLVLVSGFAAAQQAGAPASVGPESLRSAESAKTGAIFHELANDKMMVPGLNVTFGDLQRMEIYSTGDKKIGDVDKVLADSTNAIRAITVQVGGFLGIGSREAVIPIDKLQKGNEKDRLVASMSKAEIEALEEWSDAYRGSSPDRAPTAAVPVLNIPAWE
jgi:hypothetical protein